MRVIGLLLIWASAFFLEIFSDYTIFESFVIIGISMIFLGLPNRKGYSK